MVDIDKVLQAAETDRNSGFCRKCGEEHSECEPDARNRKCESCGEFEVFGAEELVIMGYGTMAPEWPEEKVKESIVKRSGIPADRLIVAHVDSPMMLKPTLPRAAKPKLPGKQPATFRPLTLKKVLSECEGTRFPAASMLEHEGILSDSRFVVRIHPKIVMKWEHVATEKPAEQWVRRISEMMTTAKSGAVLTHLSTELKDFDRKTLVHVETWKTRGNRTVEIDGVLRLTAERFAGGKIVWKYCSDEKIVATNADTGEIVGLLACLSFDR